MDKFWEKTKNAATSMTHTVTNAVTGPKHRTKDEHFNEVRDKFEEQRKRLEGLLKDINGFVAGTEAFLAAMEAIALANLSFASPVSSLKAVCDQELATIKKMREDKRNYLEPQMEEQFIRPLVSYIVQYTELHSRIAERSKRKDEMDKYKEKKDKYQEKSDPKLAEVNPKWDVAKQAYEDLNDELFRDIPLLMDNTEKFFAPLMALFIANKSKYIQAMNAHVMAELQVADLSQGFIPAVVEVITPKANSALTRQYQANPNSYITVAPPAGAGGGLTPDYGAGSRPGGVSPRPGGVSPRTSVSAGSGSGYPYGQAPAAPQGAPAQPAAHNPFAAAPPPQAVPPVPSRPGGPPPVPTRALQAKALWDFAGQPGELSFQAGEIINILANQGDWWQGEIVGRGRGQFPSNYVQMI